ncbi:MAG: glycoside hydrolase family 25 protein [Eubacterium sp.]
MAAKTKKKKTKSKSSAKRKKKPVKRQINKKYAIIIACCLTVVISLIIVAAVIHNHNNTPAVLDVDKDIAYGIDVSHYNGKIDWDTVAENVDFAFIRVGYRGYSNGSVNIDKKAKYNLKNANKSGVPVGVYFYSQATNDEEAIEEAEFVLDKIKGYDVTLPVVIDFEYAYSNGKITGRLHDADLNKKDRTSLINAFCKTVKSAGYTPAMYASTYIYESHINVDDLDKDIVIWVADYNESITYDGEFDIWQYSEKGKCEGIDSKYVDTNYWYLGK